MELDVLLLSRLQFAWTIGFHILFPTITMGLAMFLVMIEYQWLRSGDLLYFRIFRFWMKFFALSFGMGVVSGIVLSYQFGTNFSVFSDAAGNVLGPLLGYEVLVAFFLEATFLGVMLFGLNRVSPQLHFFSTCAVAVGTAMSAFWILSANSWMQTPSGVELREGIFHVTDWPEVIFNPSFPYRFAHMLLASYLTTAFVVGGVASWYLLRNEHLPFARKIFSMSMAFVAVLAPLQILVGDLHGLNTYQHQPAKVAAMEGLWETTAGAPFKVFAWPDMEAELNRFEFRIPYGSSLILEHSPGAEVPGLREWPRDERPNVAITFFSFRIMMAIGFFMLAVAMAGLWLRYHARLFESRALLRSVIIAGPLGFVATLAGWVVAEVGRQPWVVYGMMRTSDAVSPIPAQAVVISLSLFIVIYLLVFLAYLYYLLVMVRNGPDYEEPAPRGAPVRTVWLGSDWRRN